MPKERNKPIGEVECSHRGCDLKAQVYKFRSAAQHAYQRRWAGKLYALCARKHRCDDQDYLLEHATIWGAGKSDEPAPVPAPEADVSAPVKTPEKPVAASVRKAPVRTSQTPELAPVKREPKESSGSLSRGQQSTNEPSETKRGGWGWFQ